MPRTLAKLAGTDWTGAGELWLDPLGNKAHTYDCTMHIESDAVRYTWQHEGKTNKGEILFGKKTTWIDSWHQPKTIECRKVPGAWGLFALHYEYPASATENWGWRMGLYQRPTGELVLQMTNITSWGEEARAVRMVFKKR